VRIAGGLCVVLAAALGACTASSPTTVPESPRITASQQGAGHSTGNGLAAIPASSGADVALQLEALLGLHSILAADMMRARVRADDDLAQSANAALGLNTTAIADLLQPVIGTTAREQFMTSWTEHIQALFNYARGVATKDSDVRADSHRELVEYEDALGRFFAAQSDGRLTRAAARAAVDKHVNHLVAGIDAYAAHDYRASATIYRLSYAHSFDLGASLSHALLPAKVGATLDSPAQTLRTSLTHLLGEHVALMMATVRSSVGDQRDFTAMGAAVNANTLDLTAAFDSLFGPAAARRFQARWADHVDHLLAYTSAAVRNDDSGRQNARRGMREFDSSFAAFLSAATENRLPGTAMVGTFEDYDRRLLSEIDAYVSNDHERAQAVREQLYAETFTVAQQLSGAIGATLGARLPRGGSQTGGGGTAVHFQGG
jgi:hypothetical protein